MRSVFKSLISVNCDFVYGLIKILLPRLFDKHNFCRAFNFISWCRGCTIRFEFDGLSNHYLAKDGSSVKLFDVKDQNLYTYQNGFAYRARNLAEVYLLNMINFSDNDIVIDCGANNGDLLMSLETYSANINYIAFEPGPIEFATLKQNIKNHSSVNIALGEKTKSVKFFLSSQNADSSIVPSRSDLQSIEVQMISFSDYYQNNLSDSRIKLLKVEAEGYEPEVLEGAEYVLDKIEYIVVDGGYERGPEKAPTLPAVSNFLISRGFNMIGVGGGNRLVALFKNNDFQ